MVEPVSPFSRAGCGRACVAVLTGWLWQSLCRRSHWLVVVEPVSQFLRLVVVEPVSQFLRLVVVEPVSLGCSHWLVVVEPVSPFSRAGCGRACVAVLTGWLW